MGKFNHTLLLHFIEKVVYLLLVVHVNAVRWLFNGRLIPSVGAVIDSIYSPQVMRLLADGKVMSEKTV